MLENDVWAYLLGFSSDVSSQAERSLWVAYRDQSLSLLERMRNSSHGHAQHSCGLSASTPIAMMAIVVCCDSNRNIARN